MKFNFKQVVDRRDLPPDEEVYSQLLGTQINFADRYYATCIRHNKEDNNPSLTFMEKDGKIVWKDWGSGLSGDVFDFLKLYFKDTYLQSIQKYMMLPKKTLVTNTGKAPKISMKVAFEETPLDQFDYAYWQTMGINKFTLDKYCVKRASRLFDSISMSTLAKHNIISPIYIYDNLGEHGLSFQIYRPCAIKSRRFQNIYVEGDDVIFGYNQLPWLGKDLIITKSMKDVMTLDSLGISAIAPSGEGLLLPKQKMDELKTRFERFFVLFDNDNAGIDGSTKYVNAYKCLARFIPKTSGCKDVSEYYTKYGKEETSNLLQSMTKS